MNWELLAIRLIVIEELEIGVVVFEKVRLI